MLLSLTREVLRIINKIQNTSKLLQLILYLARAEPATWPIIGAQCGARLKRTVINSEVEIIKIPSQHVLLGKLLQVVILPFYKTTYRCRTDK